MSAPNDTSPEAQRILNDIFRRMTPARKWQRLADLYRTARILHEAGVRDRNPSATSRDVLAAWLACHRGVGRLPDLEDGPMAQPQETYDVIREVAAALTGLGIPYAVGGSVASSVHGVPRFTQDADLSVEPFPGREAELVARFGPEYYVSPEAVAQANRERSSFNLIHAPTGFKVDVFVRKDRAFERSALARRTLLGVPDPQGAPLFLVTAEDVVLFKLEWFRLGEEVSDRQWADILGVLRTQAGRLDEPYLDHWAVDLGVKDLLERAREEAGPAVN